MSLNQLLFSQLPKIGLLDGWRRNFVAFCCGVMATFALPPFFLFPLLVPAFTGLIWLMDGAPSRKRVFWDGWWWGWGFYISGLYWFCIALMTDAEKFAWLLPFALFGLTAVIALYQGVACWLMSFVQARGLVRIFAFSVIWVLIEFARGHLFTGFPWNLAGYALAVSDVSIQLASLVGIYGLTWLVVFLSMLPAALGNIDIPVKQSLRAVSIAYICFAVALVWGAWRLHDAGDTQYSESVKLRLVQANIKQHHKWDPKLQMQGVREHARLTHTDGLQDITHVIWPETAVPYVLKENSPLLGMLGSILPQDTHLIAGSLRAEEYDTGWDALNSMVIINSSGRIAGYYDKNKLVPFGEFLPFRSLIPEGWSTPVGNKDFARGPGAQILDWPKLSGVAPLICYEAIFPSYARHAPARPAMFLNLTNDAWFGTSSAPYQHLQMARMRAVEQGVPLIRVANTGVSAVIDSYGRMVDNIPLNQQAVLDTRLPLVTRSKTFYSSISEEVNLIVLVVGLIFLLGLKTKKVG